MKAAAAPSELCLAGCPDTHRALLAEDAAIVGRWVNLPLGWLFVGTFREDDDHIKRAPPKEAETHSLSPTSSAGPASR
jgi:hypothetical protein